MPLHLYIIQLKGVKHSFASFAEEVTVKEFLGGSRHAIIHSQVIIDPFSADPVLIIGSRNFSASVSSKKRRKFYYCKGKGALAEATATFSKLTPIIAGMLFY